MYINNIHGIVLLEAFHSEQKHWRLQMWKILRISVLVTALLSGGALAAGTYSLRKSGGVIDALTVFVKTHTAKGLVAWYELSLRCTVPGKMLYIVPGAPLDIGTRCNENSKIHAVDGGVNYGHIERLKSVGIPVDWLRSELSDPRRLKAAYDLIGADTIHEAVLASLTGEYAVNNVYAHKESNWLEVDMSRLNEHMKEYLQGFIQRRISEAKPKDRQEIARIWGEIINEQVDFLLVDPLLIPEIRTQKKRG